MNALVNRQPPVVVKMKVREYGTKITSRPTEAFSDPAKVTAKEIRELLKIKWEHSSDQDNFGEFALKQEIAVKEIYGYGPKGMRYTSYRVTDPAIEEVIKQVFLAVESKIDEILIAYAEYLVQCRKSWADTLLQSAISYAGRKLDWLSPIDTNTARKVIDILCDSINNFYRDDYCRRHIKSAREYILINEGIDGPKKAIEVIEYLLQEGYIK